MIGLWNIIDQKLKNTLDNEKKKRLITAPKKTWGRQWFSQVSFFVAIFVTNDRNVLRKAPRFLAATR